MENVMNRLWLFIGFLAFSVGPALAAQYVYPSQGQTPEQQSKDEYECHSWAVQQTGVDPTRPTSASGNNGGRRLGGTAVRGAVIGGVIGSLDGNWGKGAAIGAGAGAVVGAGRNASNRARREEANRQANTEYVRARSSCLIGRGYTVK